MRHRVADIATEVVGVDRSTDVAIVTSELVTNALEHGATPPIEVIVSVDDESMTVDVTGESVGLPEPPEVAAPIARVRGRGLRIVAGLSDNVLVTGRDGRVGVAARFEKR